MYEPQNQSKEWDQRSINSKRHIIAKPKEYLNLLHDVTEQKSKEKIFDAVFNLLNSFDYIEVLISDEAEELEGGIDVLIDYYTDTLEAFSNYSQFVEQLEALELINNTLSKIQNDIKEHSIELQQKLYSHLISSNNSYVQSLLRQLDNTEEVWLRSILSAAVEVGHRKAVNSITATKQKTAFTYSSDSLVKRWDLECGRETKSVSLSNSVSALAVTQTGKIIVIGYKNGDIEAVDVATEKVIAMRTNLHQSEIQFIAISPDVNWLASYDKANKLVLLNLKKLKSVRTLSASEPIYSLTFSTDSKKLLAGFANRTIKAWDMKRLGAVDTFSARLESRDPVNLLTVIEGKNHIVAASLSSSIISILDCDSGRILHSLNSRSGNIDTICCYKDELLCVGQGSILRVWELQSRSMIAQWKATDIIKSCAVADDGSCIIFGEESGKIYFVSLQNYTLKKSEENAVRFQARRTINEVALFRSAFRNSNAPKPVRVKPVNTQNKREAINWLGILTRLANAVPRRPIAIFSGFFIVYFLTVLAYTFLSNKTEPTVQVSQSKSPSSKREEPLQSSPSPSLSETPTPRSTPESTPTKSPTPQESPIDPTLHDPLNSKPSLTGPAAAKRSGCISLVRFFEDLNWENNKLQRNTNISTPKERKQFELLHASLLDNASLQLKLNIKLQDPTLEEIRISVSEAFKDMAGIKKNFGNEVITPDQYEFQNNNVADRVAILHNRFNKYCESEK